MGKYSKAKVARLSPMERVFGSGMLKSVKSIDRVANSSWGERTVRTRKL